jgi:hypothetical protein
LRFDLPYLFDIYPTAGGQGRALALQIAPDRNILRLDRQLPGDLNVLGHHLRSRSRHGQAVRQGLRCEDQRVFRAAAVETNLAQAAPCGPSQGRVEVRRLGITRMLHAIQCHIYEAVGLHRLADGMVPGIGSNR